MRQARAADRHRKFLLACGISAALVAGATAGERSRGPSAVREPLRDTATLQELHTRAEHGDPQAQFRLGLQYARGDGVKKDYRKAIKWYRRAATQGHARAQLSLGVLYQKGVSIRFGYSEAVRMYRAAAEQGNDAAQFNLGMMYVRGHGILQDFVQGYKWFQLSARQGNVAAHRNLERVARLMDADEIAVAKRLVRAWMAKR